MPLQKCIAKLHYLRAVADAPRDRQDVPSSLSDSEREPVNVQYPPAAA